MEVVSIARAHFNRACASSSMVASRRIRTPEPRLPLAYPPWNRDLSFSQGRDSNGDYEARKGGLMNRSDVYRAARAALAFWFFVLLAGLFLISGPRARAAEEPPAT